MLAEVDHPLGVSNRNQIADMSIPINAENEVLIADVASALIKRILGNNAI